MHPFWKYVYPLPLSGENFESQNLINIVFPISDYGVRYNGSPRTPGDASRGWSVWIGKTATRAGKTNMALSSRYNPVQTQFRYPADQTTIGFLICYFLLSNNAIGILCLVCSEFLWFACRAGFASTSRTNNYSNVVIGNPGTGGSLLFYYVQVQSLVVICLIHNIRTLWIHYDYMSNGKMWTSVHIDMIFVSLKSLD